MVFSAAFFDFSSSCTVILAQQSAVPKSLLASLWDFLSTGGFVMLLIVLCSFVAVSVMITAFLRLRDELVLPAEVMTQLRSLPNYAAKGDIKPLQEYLSGNDSLLAKLGSLAISGTFSSRQECVDTLTARAKDELHHLERGIPLLEVMVTVAPLLGLLGTTAGLVGMFSAFGGSAGPDTTAVAREIGVALRCTIAGLFVAVPSVIAHTYFVRRLDTIGVRLESIMHETIQTFFAHFEVQRLGLSRQG
jgi:biopolymer transport protein ExbB